LKERAEFWSVEYAGEVGEDWGGWFGDKVDWVPPVMEAVRWEEAAMAAAEGFKEELSVRVWFS
jgi:hypothetical protein